MAEPVRMHAWVEGRVQGVGFRYFVRQRAAALPITGWVRNLSDGRVEVLAEGQPADLESLLASLRQGPTGSLVTHVSVDWERAAGDFVDFNFRPTEYPR
ncbi:MAG: acylphosphatase [Anaerolineales bacterium]